MSNKYEDLIKSARMNADCGEHMSPAEVTTLLNVVEAKCAALAAELSAIEAIHNDAVFITDAHYDQCHPEVQKIIGALAVLQIPAYQAFLAEVRAQGVDSAINTVIAMMNHQHPVTSKAIDIMRVHAYQIRKGVQS